MSEKQKPNSSRGQSAGDDSIPVEEAAHPDVVGNRPAPVEDEDEVVLYEERRVRIREDINERHGDEDVEVIRCDVPTVAFIGNDAVPIYGNPGRGTSIEVETGCLKGKIQELSAERDRLREQLARLDITHQEDIDRDTEDRRGISGIPLHVVAHRHGGIGGVTPYPVIVFPKHVLRRMSV